MIVATESATSAPRRCSSSASSIGAPLDSRSATAPASMVSSCFRFGRSTRRPSTIA